MGKESDLYLVFEIRRTRELKPGGYIGTVPEDAYYIRDMPEPIGTFATDTAQEACVEAARVTRQLGNYVAVKVEAMSIDFTATAANMLGNGDQ